MAPSLVSAHLVSDALIGLSYLAISITLAYLVYRARHSIPFGWMFLCFGAFIVACGATHFMEILTLWRPVFWTAADVKIVTALASVGTAVARAWPLSGGSGQGAEFTVELPEFAAVERATSRLDLDPAIPNLSKVRVLVVDDDPETLEMLRDGLVEFGAAVQTAGSVDEARQAIATEPPDVIVCDLAMPLEDGLALIAGLRARRIDIPAVALTAHVRAEDRARVVSAGFQRYMSKPTTPLEVAREIDAARSTAI